LRGRERKEGKWKGRKKDGNNRRKKHPNEFLATALPEGETSRGNIPISCGLLVLLP